VVPVTIEVWLTFVAASTVLLVIPGPPVLLVVSYALGQGWRAALPTAIGVAHVRRMGGMPPIQCGALP
jgi:threonine/homoserine/homoserine lactone efflux protein